MRRRPAATKRALGASAGDSGAEEAVNSAGRFRLAVVLCALLLPAPGQSQDDLRALYLAGQLQEAVEKGRTAGSANEFFLEALIDIGEASEALDLIAADGPPHLLFARGRALYSLGRLPEADAAFEQVAAAGGANALRATSWRGQIAAELGNLDAAEGYFDQLIRAYNARSDLTGQDLIAVGLACQWLGREDPQLFKDALRAFDEAAAVSPRTLEPGLLIGELFLEKYDSGQAREALASVVTLAPEHPRALLALAKVHHFDGSPEAMTLTEKALDVAPKHVPAQVFRASLLLEQEDADGAVEALETALTHRPGDLEATSYLAAAHYLREETDRVEALQRQVLERNPRYADLFSVLAEVSVQNRLYPEARDFAARATELDEKSWRAFGVLGQNQLRLGEMEDGRKNLEAAFAGDPYNVWIKNTLDLLDKDTDYVVTETPRFKLVIHKDESQLLAPILAELAERSFDSLKARYQYEPGIPIRVEVYADHADFSVRTVGLAGLGALGVSFGPVIAIDSPSARDLGSFNFGTTFWHELAHTFTLGYTDSKIPRWLTEGLSVFEEHQSGQIGWGDDPSREFLQALKDGKLLSLTELNQGFVRPSFPNQIGLSYYQASLICELINERYGWDKMLRLLQGYREGLDTAQGIEVALGKTLEDFNEEYFEWLEKRFESPLIAFGDSEAKNTRSSLAAGADDNPDNFRMQLAKGAELIEASEFKKAIPYLERAKELFPAFVGGGNAYVQLAKVYEELERPADAVAELTSFTEINEYSYEEHRKLAELLADHGQASEEIAVLERARYIYPYELDLHQRLADLAEGDSAPEAAGSLVRARQAILALGPPNRAQAHYSLATALLRDGREREARRQVLSALELAPSYSEAQDLLLELVGEGR